MKRSSNILIWLAIAIVVVGIVAVDYFAGPGHRIVSRAETELGLSPAKASERVLPVEENELIRRMMDLHAVYAGKAMNATAKPFALAVATVDGRIYHVGAYNATFPLGNAGRAVILAAALENKGADQLMRQVGMFATGLPRNSMLALEVRPVKLQNPFTSVGAMAGACLARGTNVKDRLAAIGSMLEGLTGEPGRLTAESKNRPGRYRTLALAYQAADMGLVPCNPDDAVLLETTVAAAPATPADLAVMGATLANQGVNPVTAERVLTPDEALYVLSAMNVGGLSDMSGPWAAAVGLPALFSESGAVMAVVPGRLAVAAYSPERGMCRRSAAASAVVEFVRGHGLHPLAEDKGLGVKESKGTCAPNR